MKNHKVKNIIWDFNGTIIDDVEICYNIFIKETKNFNLPSISISKYRDIFSFPVKDFYVDYGFPNDDTTVRTISERFAEQYLETRYNALIHKGVGNLLKLSQNLGIKQYVLSAYRDDELHNMLTKLGLSDYFTDIVGVEDNRAGSKLEIGKDLFTKHHIEADKTVLIGDTTHDYDVAKYLNIEPIIVANGHNSKIALEKYGVDRIFETIKDVERYILS